MKLSEILNADAVRIPLRSRAKDDVLRELVTLLPCARDDAKLEKVYSAILEREKRMSTGIGQGIAIPHGKSDVVDEMEIAFGLTSAPIDFEALDGAPVGILFLLVSPPDMTGPHLKALAQISRMLASDSVRRELQNATSADAVLELFRREEALLGE